MNKHQQYLYLIFYPVQITALISAIYGAMHFEWINLVFFFIGWVLLCGVGSAIVLHRMLSHKALKPHKWLEKPLSILAALCIQGSPLWWVNTHRGLHHKFTDTDKDPHTPVKGRWNAYHGWVHGEKVGDINPRYVTDMLRDPFQIDLAKNYMWYVFSIYALVGFISPMFLIWGLIVPAAWSYHQESIVNTWCHLNGRGERNFETNELSVNLRWLSWFTWGQALHNNHHARPGYFDFSLGNKGEFDPCSLLYPLLARKDQSK